MVRPNSSTLPPSFAFAMAASLTHALAAADIPQAVDDRLSIQLYAEAPQIVTPVSMVFDQMGRLLVIENHTHFRPADYSGPTSDRIRIVADADADGKADSFSTFFDGERDCMDLALHPDGSIYLATRRRIIRLEDTDGDGRADEKSRIVTLKTAGDYPHNALSGMAFDFWGNLFFGLGENLGESYELVGSDGKTLRGGGEGGSTYRCLADGSALRRTATGFWNPFGQCVDVIGHVFAVDNDPDSRPPCRLLHVTDGSDFGYQFRYGRPGLSPFQAWDGELPGTLPMVAGTGEAPCELIAYESNGLPADYRGCLLTASWGDHRIERYRLKSRGASFVADREDIVQGGPTFRPVGMAVAPDGSLYVSDWVDKSYELHGKGRIWRIRWKQSHAWDRASDPGEALRSADRRTRERAARQLASNVETGIDVLRDALQDEDVRVRAVAVQSLVDTAVGRQVVSETAADDDSVGIRSLAVQLMAERGMNVARFAEPSISPRQRAAALRAMGSIKHLPAVLSALEDDDPFVRSAAVHAISVHRSLRDAIDWNSLTSTRQRVGVILACERSEDGPPPVPLSELLRHNDDEVRYLAARWIANAKRTDLKDDLVECLDDPTASRRVALACLAALAHLDDKTFDGRSNGEFLRELLEDRSRSTEIRLLALESFGAANIPLELLRELVTHTDFAVREQAVFKLAGHSTDERFEILRMIAHDRERSTRERLEALVGLAPVAHHYVDEVLRWASGEELLLREEALRVLMGVSLSDEQEQRLRETARRHPSSRQLVDRLLVGSRQKAPVHEDTAAWLERLKGTADPAAGRRLFFNVNLVSCSKCHSMEQRGSAIGPELVRFGQTKTKSQLLEAILQPDKEIAPQFQSWTVTTNDGRQFTGFLHRPSGKMETYVDANGELLEIPVSEIESRGAVPNSVMPAEQLDGLSDDELRNLIAYLTQPE